MQKIKSVLADARMLRSFVESNADNGFIAGEYQEFDDPLPLLTIEDGGQYFLHMDEQGMIIASLSFFPEDCGASDLFPEEPVISFGSVCVRPEYQGQKRSEMLLTDLFEMASRERKPIAGSAFRAQGRMYLCPVMAAVHQKFPEVRVRYRGASGPVTGHYPYRIVCDSKGYSTLIFA